MTKFFCIFLYFFFEKLAYVIFCRWRNDISERKNLEMSFFCYTFALELTARKGKIRGGLGAHRGHIVSYQPLYIHSIYPVILNFNT